MKSEHLVVFTDGEDTDYFNRNNLLEDKVKERIGAMVNHAAQNKVRVSIVYLRDRADEFVEKQLREITSKTKGTLTVIDPAKYTKGTN